MMQIKRNKLNKKDTHAKRRESKTIVVLPLQPYSCHTLWHKIEQPCLKMADQVLYD